MTELRISPNVYRWMFHDLQSSNDCQIISRLRPHEPRPISEDEVEYVEQDGYIQAQLKHRDLNPSLGSDADNVTYDGPHHLCNSCLSAIGYLIHHHQERREYELAHPESKPSQDVNHPARQPLSAIQHGSLSALLRSARSGCHICRIIANSCWKDVYEVINKAPPERPPYIELLFNEWDEAGKELGNFRLVCAFSTVTHSNQPSRDNYVNVVRFQLWPSSKINRYIPLQDASAGLPQNSEKSHTRSSRPLALRWLHDCLTNADGKHDACNANNSSWLPTRLLDVGYVRTSGRVRLITSTQMKNQIGSTYISLSHCWGEWGGRKNLPILTQSAISSMQAEGLQYELLPQTFKDAVDIAGWFGVQYLWIDSLCILQDVESDWVAEASQMSHVFANALLNISASLSADARGGCFADRDPAGCEMFKLIFKGQQDSWSVTLDERNLFDWVSKEPLTTRAWVYQERQLSARVLHFTSREVFWECMAEAPSFKSELWPQGSPLKRDFLGQSKISQSSCNSYDYKSVVGQGNPVVRDVWDEVCEGFSRRRLSYLTDKLPSLSGLASHFGKARPGDTYLAGHWRSGLPRSLVWTVKDTKSTQILSVSQHDIQPYIVPSWSWLSINAAITCPVFDDMHSILDIDFVSTTPRTFDPYGGISVATLRVTGHIRQITCSTEPSPFSGYALELYQSLDTAEQKNLYTDSNLEKGHHIGSVCGAAPPHYLEQPDCILEDTEWRNYHCLFIGVSVVWLQGAWVRTLECLLLEAVEGEGEDCFRRVGVFSVYDGQCALKLRYRKKIGYELDESETEDESDEGNVANEVEASKLNGRDNGDSEAAIKLDNDKPTKHEPDHDIESKASRDSEGGADESGREAPKIEKSDPEADDGQNFVPESGLIDPISSDADWRQCNRINTPWRRLWRQIEPQWAGGGYKELPKEVFIVNTGPMSLYDYDGGIESDMFEKLTPRTITLI